MPFVAVIDSSSKKHDQKYFIAYLSNLELMCESDPLIYPVGMREAVKTLLGCVHSSLFLGFSTIDIFFTELQSAVRRLDVMNFLEGVGYYNAQVHQQFKIRL